MEVSIEIRRQLYEAINTEDTETLRKISDELPGALGEGWTGKGSPSYLHISARKGKLQICQLLVELGIDVNTPTPMAGDTVPLEEAATGGHLSVVKWLLDNGAAVDGLSTSVATPLMGAAMEGHIDVVLPLLEAGAEINREHLRLPQTALDFAEVYKVKQSGQGAVAALLRECGGIRPYLEPHDWTNVPGQLYIEHIERAIGGFANPIGLAEAIVGDGHTVTIRRARIPTKYEFQLLFTVGLAHLGVELALCLPSAWPLNNATLKEYCYAWPTNLLLKLSKMIVQGSALTRGDLLDAEHSALAGFEWPAPTIRQWLLTLNQCIEAEREGDYKLPQTLLVTPILTKKQIKPGAAAMITAEKLENAKWKALALPMSGEH